MYDKHPVKKALLSMNVGGVRRFSLQEVKRGYFLAILKHAKKETGREYTSSKDKDGEHISVIRLS